MNKGFLKMFLGGALVGTLIFLAPFAIIKVALLALMLKMTFHLLFGARRRRYMWAYADRIRNMSEEEYQDYKSNYRKGRCR